MKGYFGPSGLPGFGFLVTPDLQRSVARGQGVACCSVYHPNRVTLTGMLYLSVGTAVASAEHMVSWHSNQADEGTAVASGPSNKPYISTAAYCPPP